MRRMNREGKPGVEGKKMPNGGGECALCRLQRGKAAKRRGR